MESQAVTLAAPRRVRRSTRVLLHTALDDAAKAMTADTSTQKLVQARIDCLLKLQSRERNDKLRKLTDELKSAKAEIVRLRSEIEHQRGMAAKQRATVSHISEIEVALSKYRSHEAGEEK